MKEATQKMDKHPSVIKTCPSCGATFGCLHSKDCWCAGYVVPPSVAESIRKEHSGCLCQACLVEYGAEKKK